MDLAAGRVSESWLSVPRARRIDTAPKPHPLFAQHAANKPGNAYLFTNQYGGQLKATLVRKFPLGFRRHALRHYAASTWLRLDTPVHEVAEYLGDDPRTVLKIYAHILGEGQRRDFVQRLGAAEELQQKPGHYRDTDSPISPENVIAPNPNIFGI